MLCKFSVIQVMVLYGAWKESGWISLSFHFHKMKSLLAFCLSFLDRKVSKIYQNEGWLKTFLSFEIKVEEKGFCL